MLSPHEQARVEADRLRDELRHAREGCRPTPGVAANALGDRHLGDVLGSASRSAEPTDEKPSVKRLLSSRPVPSASPAKPRR